MQRDNPCIRLFKLSIVAAGTPAVRDESMLPIPTAVLYVASEALLFIAVTAATGRLDPTAADNGAIAGLIFVGDGRGGGGLVRSGSVTGKTGCPEETWPGDFVCSVALTAASYKESTFPNTKTSGEQVVWLLFTILGSTPALLEPNKYKNHQILPGMVIELEILLPRKLFLAIIYR